ncbi:MAG: hypothetical protein U0802_15850 [Candidatus Binatia bacterium]
MDATLKGLVGLVESGNAEARCAALVVLTQLAIDDDKVARAVAGAVASANVLVRDFALGYFERVRSPQSIAAVTPLLDAEEEPVRRRAVALLAPHGAAAIGAARKLLAGAPRRRLTAIVDLCAQVRTAAALETLRPRSWRATTSTPTAPRATPCWRSFRPSQNASAPTSSAAPRPSPPAPGPPHPSPSPPPSCSAAWPTRRRARRSRCCTNASRSSSTPTPSPLLPRRLRGKPLGKQEIDALLPLLDHDDEVASSARPRLLEDQSFDRGYLARLNQLAESPQPIVKRFAVGTLGGFESGGVVKTLIGYLTDDSYARRDQAIATLKTLPAARLPLMKEPLACEDERKA